MNPLKLLFSFGLKILLWAAAPAAFSQTCTAFYPLEDATGIEFLQTHQIESLNEAACSLRAALPQEFQSDFAVYDLGFYSHHISYEGGIPDVLQQVIDGLTTDYYIIFGREMNRDEELERVWVEVGLPDGDFLSCLEPSQKSFHAHMAGIILNEPTINGGFSGLLYMSRIIASFDYLTGVLEQLEDCCDQQSGLRSVSECSHCPQDVGQFRSFMEANGFIGIEVENLVASSYYDTTGNIREYVEITLELAGEPLNVNEDVIGFLHRMDNAMEGVYGSLYYYDPLDPHCEKVMEVVSGTYSLPLAFRESDVSRSVSEEVVLEITTIGTVDENGGGMVHVKVEIPFQMTNTGKTIFLQCVGDCGFDMDSVELYLEHFYSLLGTYELEELVFNPETGFLENKKVDLIPDITIYNGKLTLETIKDGVVVLFGEASSLISAIQDPDFYRFLAGEWGYQTSGGICRMYANRDLHGMGQLNPPNRFSIIRNNYIEDAVSQLRANGNNHAAAFLALHETGHNAEIEHFTPNGSRCNGYMSDGIPLTSGYFLTHPTNHLCCCIKGGRDLRPSPEELIILSFDPEMHFQDLSHIKKAIYERFIK